MRSGESDGADCHQEPVGVPEGSHAHALRCMWASVLGWVFVRRGTPWGFRTLSQDWVSALSACSLRVNTYLQCKWWTSRYSALCTNWTSIHSSLVSKWPKLSLLVFRYSEIPCHATPPKHSHWLCLMSLFYSPSAFSTRWLFKHGTSAFALYYISGTKLRLDSKFLFVISNEYCSLTFNFLLGGWREGVEKRERQNHSI